MALSAPTFWITFVRLFWEHPSISFPFLSASANCVSVVNRHCLFCLTAPPSALQPPPREACVLLVRQSFGPKPLSTRGTVWLARAVFTDRWATAPFSSVPSSVNTAGRYLSQISKEETEIELCHAVQSWSTPTTAWTAIVRNFRMAKWSDNTRMSWHAALSTFLSDPLECNPSKGFACGLSLQGAWSILNPSDSCPFLYNPDYWERHF